MVLLSVIVVLELATHRWKTGQMGSLSLPPIFRIYFVGPTYPDLLPNPPRYFRTPSSLLIRVLLPDSLMLLR